MVSVTKLDPLHIKYFTKAKDETSKGIKLYKLYLETQNPAYLYLSYLKFRKAYGLLNRLYASIEGETDIGEIGWFNLSEAFNNLAKQVSGGLQWLVNQASNLASSVQSALTNLGDQIRQWFDNAQKVLGEWWNVLCSHIANFPTLFKEWLMKTKFGLDLSPALKVIEEKKEDVRNFIILYSRLKKTRLSGEKERKRQEILDKYGWIYNFFTNPLVKPILFPLIGLKESEISGIGEIGEIPVAYVAIIIAICILVGMYEWAQINSSMSQLLRSKTEYKAVETITKEIDKINQQIDYYKKIGDWDKVKELESKKQELLNQLSAITGEKKDFLESLEETIPSPIRPFVPYIIGVVGLVLLLLLIKKVME